MKKQQDEPHWEYWAVADEWSLGQAICLLLRVNPMSTLGSNLIDGNDRDTHAQSTRTKKYFSDYKEYASLASGSYARGALNMRLTHGGYTGSTNYFVSPKEWINWIGTKKLPIPEKLEHLAFAPDADTNDTKNSADWPWGKHSTKLLEDLSAAAKRFWRNVDPKEPDTAPTSEEVIGWLRNERKVAKRVAQVMAQMLRADNLRSGPRK